MKSLNEHLEEQLNEGALTSLGISALIFAAIFCTSNGLYAIYQLVKNRGTKGAYENLLKSLDNDSKAKAKELENVDLSELQDCKALVDAINSNKSFDEICKLYEKARQEIMYCGKADKTTNEIENKIKKIADNAEAKINANYDRKIKWFITPLEFFVDLMHAPVFASNGMGKLGKLGKLARKGLKGFGGGSTFGGGAGSKW